MPIHRAAIFALAAFAVFVPGATYAQAQKQRGPQQFTSPVKPGEPDKKFPLKVIWVVKEFNGKPVSSDLTLSIDDNFRGAGASGCNTWSASVYPQRGQRLAVGPIALTSKTCDAGTTSLENAYLTAVHAAPFWDLEGSYLILKGPGGVLRFQRSI